MTWRVLVAALLLSTGAWAQSTQAILIGNGAEERVLGDAEVSLILSGIEVQPGGSLVLSGSSPTGQGAISAGTTSGISITVSSGGAIDFKFGKLESISVLTISSGGKVLRLHDTVFTDLANLTPVNTAWIDLSLLVVGDRENLPFSFNRVSFIDQHGTPTRKNIKSGAATPLLRLLGNSTAHGNCWGEASNDDSANAILWHTGVVTRTGPTGAFDTIEEALKDGSTATGSTISVTLGPTGFIDDIADFNSVPSNGATSTGPTLIKACLAPMIGKAVLDADGDTSVRGKLINCIIARGTVEETTAENCTFFDPGAAVISLNNVTGKNALIESGYAGTGNTLTTSLTTATAAFFASASGYDFHLVSPGGDGAIDEGAILSVSTDIDSQPRAADGKAGGTGTWDIGADEIIIIVTPIITTPNNKKTNDNTPIVTGTTSPNVTITLYFNGNSDGTTTSNGSGVWTYHNLTATKTDATYVITAIATNGSVTSFTSAAILLTVDTICNPPINVTATPKNTVIDIEWTPSPDPDVVGYRIYRSTTGPGGTFTLLTPSTQLITGTKYRDSGLSNTQQYSYKVAAVDDALNEKH